MKGINLFEYRCKERIRGILKNTDPHLFDIQEEEQQVSLMDTLRRTIINTITKFGGATLLANVNLEIISGPIIEPEEYLAQATASIDVWWEALNRGSYSKVEKALKANMPT